MELSVPSEEPSAVASPWGPGCVPLLSPDGDTTAGWLLMNHKQLDVLQGQEICEISAEHPLLCYGGALQTLVWILLGRKWF